MVKLLTFFNSYGRRCYLADKLTEIDDKIKSLTNGLDKRLENTNKSGVEALLCGSYILRRLLKRVFIDVDELYEEFKEEYGKKDGFTDKKIFYDQVEMVNNLTMYGTYIKGKTTSRLSQLRLND